MVDVTVVKLVVVVGCVVVVSAFFAVVVGLVEFDLTLLSVVVEVGGIVGGVIEILFEVTVEVIEIGVAVKVVVASMGHYLDW